jgi:adenylosuccinate lyase
VLVGAAGGGPAGVAWENAAESLLERTLDDSANRRVILPEAFLAIEECLLTAERIITGLQVDAAAAAANLEKYGPFAATERVMMALVRAGGDRQRAHERCASTASKPGRPSKPAGPNPLGASLAGDPDFLVYLQPARLRELMDARAYVGTAGRACRGDGRGDPGGVGRRAGASYSVKLGGRLGEKLVLDIAPGWVVAAAHIARQQRVGLGD